MCSTPVRSPCCASRSGRPPGRPGPTPGPLRVFDPNVRPTLLPDAAAVTALRELVEEFFATADLVKLSSADAALLYDGATPAAAADLILQAGRRRPWW